jgi:hypothetical protein
MSEIKSIYDFTVSKTTEIEENGQKITKLSPVYFRIKRPSRVENEDAGLIYSKYLNEYFRKGVLPEAILTKIYENQGGTISENERASLIIYQLKLIELEENYKQLGVEKVASEKLDEIKRGIVEVQNKIADIYFKQTSFYQDTAEFKAKLKKVTYLTGVLTYFRKDDKSEWQRYFNSNEIEGILEESDKLEESGDEIYLKIKDRLSFPIFIYLQNPSIKSEEIAAKAQDFGIGE